MNKKRWIGTGVAVVILSCLAVFFIYMQPAVSGVASSATPKYVFADQQWTLQFTRAMNKSTITEDSVYVLNKENERVPVSLSLNDRGTILSISAPDSGYENLQEYTLHLSNDVKSRLGLSVRGDQKVAFQVVNDLPTVESLDDLKEHFLALLEKTKKYEQEYAVAEESSMQNSAEDSAVSGDSSGGMGGDADYSQTNNQVEGVNEADIVQTDGEYIYHIEDQRIINIVRADPSDSMEPISTIPFEEHFYPIQLFLQDDKLVVIGDKWIPYTDNKSTSAEYRMDQGVTVAKIYNVKDKSAPKLEREVGTEGYFNNARMIESNLYFITNYSPNIWMLEEYPDLEMRPHILDSKNGDSLEPIAVEDISILPEHEENQYSIITVVDIQDPKSEVNTETYLGSSGQLYMSQNSLYLAASYPMFSIMSMDIMPAGSGNADTDIYKFNIDGMNVDFVSKGTVKGTVLNQFSMDEHNGNFRVVTTEGNTFGNNRNSVNHLFILNEKMEQIGSVEGLAKGERIYSARFMGDKAYMVTFRETDPLFVIDTANPEAPEVLGELKIPGFSTYIHPLDENHLIGFGVETEIVKSSVAGDPPLVRQAGAKVSLFDITDFANPKEKDVEIIGGPGTYSTLMHDHKALFQHKERNLYGFPITIYDEKESNGEMEFINQGAILFNITAEDGIKLTKEIYDEKKDGQQYEEWESQVQRMLYIGETLYTVSSEEVKAYDLPE